MDIRKEIKAIQAMAEKEFGSPLAKKVWDIIEDDVGNAATDYDADPEGQEAYIESYRNVTGRYVMALISALPSIKVKPSTDGNGEPTQPKKRYRKCFERRFYLVNFVIDRPYKRGTRIDWKRMVTEWNKSHPSDPMPLSTLRVEYQRAIKEDTLMLQVYIIRDNQFLTTLWQPLDKQLRDMANNNPFGFVFASLVGQKMWNDTQPLILSLHEAIRNSPMFKEIEVHNPEEAARIDSELQATANMGDLKPLGEELSKLADKRLDDLEDKRRQLHEKHRKLFREEAMKRYERTHRKEG